MSKYESVVKLRLFGDLKNDGVVRGFRAGQSGLRFALVKKTLP